MDEREEDNSRPAVALVEDDAAIAAMYRCGLEAAGFEVNVFHDPDTFLKALKDDLPAIVVLDWQLSSRLTGGDLLHSLRCEARTARLPVLFLSNQVFQPEDALAHSLRTGRLAWLTKSRTSPTDLATHVARAVELGEADRIKELH